MLSMLHERGGLESERRATKTAGCVSQRGLESSVAQPTTKRCFVSKDKLKTDTTKGSGESLDSNHEEEEEQDKAGAQVRRRLGRGLGWRIEFSPLSPVHRPSSVSRGALRLRLRSVGRRWWALWAPEAPISMPGGDGTGQGSA